MSEIARLFDAESIPGVKPAEQKRSRLLQDKFVVATRKTLLTTRLKDVPIPDLAKAAGSSVGGFYSRFETKDALFEFMRKQMFAEHLKLHDEFLDPAAFEGASHQVVSTAFVDLMLRVFSGPWRGVLREAFTNVLEHPNTWEPMKARLVYLCDRLIPLYENRIERRDGLEERLAVALQFLISIFDNEMMNPNLEFRMKDPRFRFYLIQTFNTLVVGEFPALPTGQDADAAIDAH
ncbi:MAG: TetR/AcrR family transcriptional regulator [Proteobacteria bacterium]|nr:TetR/AcrR family transcriptional regulator [Pseudomonadota bacterium]